MMMRAVLFNLCTTSIWNTLKNALKKLTEDDFPYR